MTDSIRIVLLVLLVAALGSCALQAPDEGEKTEVALVGLRQFAPDPNTYRCVALGFRELDDSGHLPEGKGYRNERIGGTFTVEKATGLMRGGIIDNSTFETRK